jgi:ABC-type branched-subunit amino acid transport system substrate-binding protein
MRHRQLTALLLVAVAATACGSTAQTRQSLSSQANAGAGSALGGPVSGNQPLPSAADLIPTDSSPAVRDNAGVPAQGSQSGAAEAGAPATNRTPTSAAARFGPGVSASTVRIGYQYIDTSGGTAALGKNFSTGDPKEQAAAVKNWINKHGGVGGRSMELISYGVPYNEYATNVDGVDQSVCSKFTEDDKVLALATTLPTRNLVMCLAKHDTIALADAYPLSREVFDRAGQWYYAPGMMSQDRGAETMVTAFARSWSTHKSKIGLVRFDEPTYALPEKSLRSALAAHGLELTDVATVSWTDLSKQETDSAAAVLRFRQDGITDVVFLDNQGGAAYPFMQAAESQAYRPIYPLTSNNGPSGLATLAPSAQLANARAVSWLVGDVGPGEQSPPAVPATGALCLKIMRDAGVALDSETAKGNAILVCADLLFAKAALDRAAAPNSAAFQQAMGTIKIADPMTYSVRLSPTRHDGAAKTRLIAFSTDCSCWKYTGPGPDAR